MVSQAISNLGIMKASAGDYDAGIRHMEEAVKLEETVLGPDHPEHARSVLSLGAMYMATGDIETGERHMREAIRIRKQRSLPGEPDTAIMQHQLAIQLAKAGELARAEALLVEAIEETGRHEKLNSVVRALRRELWVVYNRSGQTEKAAALNLPPEDVPQAADTPTQQQE
jgi:hypothetical protein